MLWKNSELVCQIIFVFDRSRRSPFAYNTRLILYDIVGAHIRAVLFKRRRKLLEKNFCVRFFLKICILNIFIRQLPNTQQFPRLNQNSNTLKNMRTRDASLTFENVFFFSFKVLFPILISFTKHYWNEWRDFKLVGLNKLINFEAVFRNVGQFNKYLDQNIMLKIFYTSI